MASAWLTLYVVTDSRRTQKNFALWQNNGSALMVNDNLNCNNRRQFVSDWKSLKGATVEVPGLLSHSDGGLFPAAFGRISNEPSADGEGNTCLLLNCFT